MNILEESEIQSKIIINLQIFEVQFRNVENIDQDLRIPPFATYTLTFKLFCSLIRKDSIFKKFQVLIVSIFEYFPLLKFPKLQFLHIRRTFYISIVLTFKYSHLPQIHFHYYSTSKYLLKK